MLFCDKQVDLMDARTADEYRARHIGFVFQDYNLLERDNVLSNVCLSALLGGGTQERATEALRSVGLEEYASHLPSELSGGQKQRIAVARALVKDADVLLADEPTGNLDSRTSEEIFALLQEVARERLVIVVTHDEESAKAYGERIIRISDGKVITDSAPCTEEGAEANKTPSKAEALPPKRAFPALEVLRRGLKNFGDRKARTVISIVSLFLSVLVMLVGQMWLSTNSEKIMGRTLPAYGEMQAIFYQNTASQPSDDSSSTIYNIPEEAGAFLEECGVPCATAFPGGSGAYRILLSSMQKAHDLGFVLYDGARELTENSVYVSDFTVEEHFDLREAPDDYSAWVGQEIALDGVPTTIVGVFRTDWRKYFTFTVEYDRDGERYWDTMVRENLSAPEYLHAMVLWDWMDNVLMTPEYHLLHTQSFRLNGNAFGLSAANILSSFGKAYEIFVETEAGTVTLGNAEINLYNGLLPAGYGYMTEAGETGAVPEPGTGEIVVTEWAYRRFFPDDKEGVFSHIGEEVTISLEHVRSHETDAQFTAKIVAVELSSGRDRNIYFAPQDALALKACCGNGERLFADLSALNPAQLTALLQGLREEYNVCTVNAVSYDVYMAEGTFQNTGIVFALIAGIMLVVSLLLIANMLSVMISDKRHEIGILRQRHGSKDHLPHLSRQSPAHRCHCLCARHGVCVFCCLVPELRHDLWCSGRSAARRPMACVRMADCAHFFGAVRIAARAHCPHSAAKNQPPCARGCDSRIAYAKKENGSKACAWLIYKSAAELTVRLTPHRHPRRFAPRAPKPSARPNGQSAQTEIKGGDGAGVRR